VQPAVMGQQTMPDGTVVNVNMPLCINVPCIFFRAGGFSVTAPVAKGDECYLMFADRCYDAWWQQGGVQPQMDMRIQDLSDAFALFGAYSQPRVLANVSTDSIQVRDDAGDTYVEVKNGHIVNIVAPGGLNITAPLTTFNGNVLITETINVQNSGSSGEASTVTGNFEVTGGDIVADGVSLKSHVHGGVQSGSDDTGVPV